MTAIEPSADQRQWALALRQAYLALVESGFTEDEAYDMTKAWLCAMTGKRE